MISSVVMVVVALPRIRASKARPRRPAWATFRISTAFPTTLNWTSVSAS